MSFKTPELCDRRVYDKKGKWKNPNQDIASNIYYFIREPLTLVPTFVNGREELKETITICVFGGKPICKDDIVTLADGTQYRVQQMIPNFIESNIEVRDMLKQRIESMDLVLQ